MLRDVIGEEAFAIASAYGKSMLFQHDSHVWAWNFRDCTPMVDSELETTRVFWRKRFYGASDEEAHDPRTFFDVVMDRYRTARVPPR